MINDAYDYVDIENKTVFIFHSEGPQGTITKVVGFTLEEDGTWNLGFGDWRDNDVDGKIMTSNHDAMRVIRTVAKATLAFFEEYPARVVVIHPVDDKRKKLYNFVFQRHFKEINALFYITGLRIVDLKKEEKEIYSPEKYYDGFELKLKL